MCAPGEWEAQIRTPLWGVFRSALMILTSNVFLFHSAHNADNGTSHS